MAGDLWSRVRVPVLSILVAFAFPGCVEDGGDAGTTPTPDASPTPPAATGASGESAPEESAGVFAADAAIGEVAGAAEMPATNPFGYRNPWA